MIREKAVRRDRRGDAAECLASSRRAAARWVVA